MVAGLVVLGVAATFPGITRAAPVECSGVPSGYYAYGLEAQGWWMTGYKGTRPEGAFWTDLPYDPAMADGHVHDGFAFPLCQTFGTAVGRARGTFTVTAKMHENPGTINDVAAKVYSGSAAHQTDIGLTDFANQSCWTTDPLSGFRDCTFTYSVTADFSRVPDNGWQSFRIRVYGRDPNGQDREAILWGPVYVSNTRHSLSNYDKAGHIRATGWYTDAGYLNVSLLSPYPVASITGTWTPTVQYWATLESCSDGKKCADEPTHLFASVDPSFHATPMNYGRILLDAAGPDTISGVTTTLKVDPKVLNLCNGPHKLFLRGDANDDRPFSRKARNSGALVIPFTTNVRGQPAC